MNVIDIMTVSPITIRPDQPLQDAVELMEKHCIKHLPVMSVYQLIGVVTDQDCRHVLNSPLIREHWQHDSLLNHVHVRSIMSPAPIVIEPDTPLIEAVRLILTHHIGCLPVVRGETLVGIVTRSDILVAFIILHRRFDQLPDVLNYNGAHATAIPPQI